ncbi:MAG: glycoside hydrolase family 73 protein [Terriglobales bacterium]|jgi:flagellum-specific peptidoglycan hydrolase FlgJ
MNKQEFIALAIAATKEGKYPAGVTVAQAALESAWGSSRLSLRANNYFGIKAHGDAESIELPTTEIANGKAVKVLARFAAYTDIATCVADRERIITQLACYQDARANASDPELFARCLARHWATDPEYAEKLLKIYWDNNLDKI